MRPTRSRRKLIDDLKGRLKPGPDLRRFVGAPILVDGSGKIVSWKWKGPPGTKYFVFPKRMSVAEWEQSGAPERQAALVADARADFAVAMAEQRPEKDLWDVTHRYKRTGQGAT